MLELFLELMERDCAPQIVQEVRAIDVQADESAQKIFRVFQHLSGEDATDCIAAYVGYLGSIMNHRTSAAVKSTFMATANRVDAAKRDELAEPVAHAWPFMPFLETDAAVYFRFAGLYRLPLPDSVEARYAPLPVSDYTDAAFAHAEYRLLVGDPQVRPDLEDALTRASGNVDRLYGLLSALVDTGLVLRREERSTAVIRDLLAPYREDARRATGVNGPSTGSSISGLVEPAYGLFAR